MRITALRVFRSKSLNTFRFNQKREKWRTERKVRWR